MDKLALIILGAFGMASAYPWVASMPGVDSSSLYKHEAPVKRQANCPFNANHPGAAPYNSKYPYTGARNGLPGTGKGGIQVPAPGDTAHQYTAPGPNDIRGPCPALNTLANHNFLSHDGITTFSELLDAQQNVFNAGYDLAVFLATFGVGLDGDPVTQKLSIGCDATSRTSATGSLLGDEGGLDTHGKFEDDSSLTRNDYFISNGDNYSFNGTRFESMRSTCNNLFNRDHLALVRYQRYQESVATNPNFFFGPHGILLYGATSFLYEMFAGTGSPDLPTMSSFFGAVSNGNGGWTHVGERIPANWSNRVTPYTIQETSSEINAQYQQHPVLFGGNVGVNNFDALNTSVGVIRNGKLPSTATAADVECLLYLIATENVPSSVSGGVLTLPVQVVQYMTAKLNPVFKNSGCPLKV